MRSARAMVKPQPQPARRNTPTPRWSGSTVPRSEGGGALPGIRPARSSGWSGSRTGPFGSRSPPAPDGTELTTSTLADPGVAQQLRDVRRRVGDPDAGRLERGTLRLGGPRGARDDRARVAHAAPGPGGAG